MPCPVPLRRHRMLAVRLRLSVYGGGVQMLVDLGQDVYQEEFERAFLKEAAEFYKGRARLDSTTARMFNNRKLVECCIDCTL